MTNIDEILDVPGIDCAVIAQFDLSTALGVHGRFDTPEFAEAVATIEQSARAHRIPLGAAALTAEQSRMLISGGYQMLFHGFDVLMLKALVAAARDWN